MRLKPVFLLLMAVALAAGAVASNGDLAVHFIDVGQADAILVCCPHGTHHMLIDAADTKYPRSSTAFREYMREHFSNERQPWPLDLVISTHPHNDHVGNMEWVLQTFDVVTYVDNGHKYDTALYGRLEKLRRKQVQNGDIEYVNGKVDSFTEVDFCSLSDVTVRIIAPWAVSSLSDTNDRSVVVALTYDDATFLFVGDAHEKAEKVMLNDFDSNDRELLNAEVLKVGHHGSNTSSSTAFINLVSPQLAVVSVGKKGVGTNAHHKHPRLSTMRRYADWFRNLSTETDGRVWAYDDNAERWRQHTRRDGLLATVKDGTVVVTTDGNTLYW